MLRPSPTLKPRLKIDLSHGEGAVVFPPGWGDLPPILRLDVLSDLIGDLNKAYEMAKFDFEAQGNVARAARAAAQKEVH